MTLKEQLLEMIAQLPDNVETLTPEDASQTGEAPEIREPESDPNDINADNGDGTVTIDPNDTNDSVSESVPTTPDVEISTAIGVSNDATNVEIAAALTRIELVEKQILEANALIQQLQSHFSVLNTVPESATLPSVETRSLESLLAQI